MLLLFIWKQIGNINDLNLTMPINDLLVKEGYF